MQFTITAALLFTVAAMAAPAPDFRDGGLDIGTNAGHSFGTGFTHDFADSGAKTSVFDTNGNDIPDTIVAGDHDGHRHLGSGLGLNAGFYGHGYGGDRFYGHGHGHGHGHGYGGDDFDLGRDYYQDGDFYNRGRFGHGHGHGYDDVADFDRFGHGGFDYGYGHGGRGYENDINDISFIGHGGRRGRDYRDRREHRDHRDSQLDRTRARNDRGEDHERDVEASHDAVDAGFGSHNEHDDRLRHAAEDHENRQLYRLMFGFDRGCKYDKGFGYSEGYEGHSDQGEAVRGEKYDHGDSERRPINHHDAQLVKTDDEENSHPRFAADHARNHRDHRDYRDRRHRDNRGYYGIHSDIFDDYDN